MTTIYLILAICIGIAIAAVILASKALRKCEDNNDGIGALFCKHHDLSEKIERCELKIKRCELDVESLARCHKKRTNFNSLLFPNGPTPSYTHDFCCKVDTETANDVTLEELAKLVLDGTPIVRDVPTKTKYGVHKGEDDGKEE